jgi:hypothetical protein
MPQIAGRRIRAGLPQQTRLLAAVIYLIGLLCLARYLNGTFWPPYGLTGLWFYSGAAALLLGEFLLEPFFTRPADAIANGIAVLIAAATVSLEGAEVSHHAARTGRLVIIVVGASIVAGGLLAVAFKDSRGFLGSMASTAAAITSRVGRASVLFSALLLASGYAAFAHSSGRIAALYITWFVIMGIGPAEALLEALSRRERPRLAQHGVVEELRDPGMAVVRLPRGAQPKLGGEVSLEEPPTVGTIVEVTSLSQEPRIQVALAEPAPIRIGAQVQLKANEADRPVIGHVSEGSTIEEISVTTVPLAAGLGLEEGRLVEVPIGETPTLYQIVAAQITSRTDESLPRQLVRVQARKLGAWNAERTVFDPVAWVPTPGSAVQLQAMEREGEFEDRFIGYVPGTQYGIAIDPHSAVTHNTAILGILGIGKTHLAWELIKRMLADGIKVVALDITGRYSQHFADLCSTETENRIAETLEAAIAANEGNRNVRNDQAGNLEDFEAALKGLLTSFVDGDERLLIINPNRFDITRMEGRPYNQQANSMARLTMVETTRLIAEQLLVLLQARQRDPQDESAVLCLVLEEAHSLVPEWNSTANAAEQQATNGSARAILQGRKYGFGCLLITQRTANVTKSLLNQCNTIFGMRVYDATGMGFLENYVGPTYAQLLASLRERQAVVFGRASSCNSPLIIEVNDSERFNQGFWRPRRGNVPPTVPPDGDAEDEPDPEPASEPDDIPF